MRANTFTNILLGLMLVSVGNSKVGDVQHHNTLTHRLTKVVMVGGIITTCVGE